MNLKKLAALVLSFGIFISVSACSGKKNPPPLVEDLQKNAAGEKPGVNGSIPSITVKMTLAKSAVFNRVFLYGADLQYSTFNEGSLDLVLQSLALGHVPAKFRIAGDELQLVADNRRLSPSDVNHPEQVLSRFRILAQDDDTLTVSGASSGPYLAEIFEGMVNYVGTTANPAAMPLKDSWIRSLEFAPEGDYLLQETSIIAADGTIAEFMESIFPSEDLAPSSSFTAIRMDPNAAPGTENGVVGRFRFLGGETTYQGEDAVTFAQHFDIGNDATIDWYVTRNIPDEDLEPVKAGVEGWNRYFRQYKGIERNVMRFRGRLPEGVKLGDPRYNVINWDSRLEAGAAYESQASDPMTGKQSHSLIYLPAAWLKIGSDYWNDGVYSDPSVNRTRTRLGKYAACLRDLRDARSAAYSGLFTTEDEVTAFSRHVVAQTLFHEVGHALGLEHNFKGSLSFDRSVPGAPFSTSIMDYNDYSLERAAFSDLLTADGPLLEYDRQAISALYNQQVDILPDAPVVPVCNDGEADNEFGGVDPLCIRYDLESDPSLSVQTAWMRITEPQTTDTDSVTLSQAIGKVAKLTLTDEALEQAKSADDFQNLTVRLVSTYRNTLRFFLSRSPGSLSRAIKTDLKLLFTYEYGILPDGYDPAAMRARLFDGVGHLLGLSELPAAPAAAFEAARAEAVSRLRQSAYVRGLSTQDADAAIKAAANSMAGVLDWLKRDSAQGLPAMRASVIAELRLHPTAPYYLGGTTPGATVDYEGLVVGILAELAQGTHHTMGERIAAARSLASFRDRFTAQKPIETVKAALELERATATTNTGRELAEMLAQILR